MDFSYDQEVNGGNWKMWRVPYMGAWLELPEQACLFRHRTERCQTTGANQIARNMRDGSWATTRGRRQAAFGHLQ
eukprot:4095935-Pyramimonas_sp.AAC.1